jgi:predicted SPOUT superfamily RNA methylase MTH1
MPQKGRDWTVSIALPGDILDNAQSQELRAYVAGQVARACSIFNVDEVVVFPENPRSPAQGCDLLARLLEYLETPQYLRKALFPIHPALRHAGLLNPLDAPHHLRAHEWCMFREGVVTEQDETQGQSMVDVGLKQKVHVPVSIEPGTRVTLKLHKPKKQIEARSNKKRKLRGMDSIFEAEAVAPSAPREELGLYWGYQVRICGSISEAVQGPSVFGDNYDLCIGTSDKGTNLLDPKFELPKFKRLLIVFGGVAGIEECIKHDSQAQSKDKMFAFYVNCCPKQGSRTIRTEEAIPITMSLFQKIL